MIKPNTFPSDMAADGYKPTSGMIAEAKRGLEWRREFNRGGTEVGVARARDISNGASLSVETIRRMSSYFARHEVDKQAQGFRQGEDGFPSAGRIAWALWGGDPGKSFVANITEQLDKKQDRNMEIETRTVEMKLEKRDDAPPVLVGYASTFDQPYSVERVQETIDRRAFDRTLVEQPNVFAFMGHDQSRIIARTKNGTLLLRPDEIGLRVEIHPIDTTESRDAFTLVDSGTIDAMSFGFRVVQQKFENRDGIVHRKIMDLDLYEVSLVAFPANPAATLSKRARDLAECVVTKRNHIRLPVEPIYKGMK